MREQYVNPIKVLWIGLCCSAGMSAQADSQTLSDALSRLSPTLNQQVLHKAVSAVDCAVKRGLPSAEKLAIIDFSKPSSQPRLWIFDLKQSRLLLRDLVAHGRNSGDNFATHFSNDAGSYQSSLGLFVTGESYTGKHGLSLRMDGLEPGFNDNARDRAIVIHGADYVDPNWIPVQGRIGRSQGCPAVRPAIAAKVVRELQDGQFVFSYYPDRNWLKKSAFINCNSQQLAANPPLKPGPSGRPTVYTWMSGHWR